MIVSRMRMPVLLVAVILALGVAGNRDADLESRLADARTSYDAEAAMAVLSEARSLRTREPGTEHARLQVEAAVAVAELLRIEYEQLPEDEREARRQLGSKIDAVAEETLGIVDELPESSARERMRADLIATMIRSDFRARKYRDELETAIARARELDPDNPRALVAAAKPLVFAPEEKGRDLAEAARLLDRALELEPGLEEARLLRAEAHRRAGDREAAREDLEAALGANPSCRPARHALEAMEGATDG